MDRWRVVRLDDNGNTYVVVDDLSEAEARRKAAELEARAHKQSYEVERMPARPAKLGE